MAAQIEAGTLEFTLRDTRRRRSRGRAICPHPERQPRGRAAEPSSTPSGPAAPTWPRANPDAVAAVEALVRFVESPGQTLVIKLTPRGKVPALQLFQTLKTDPLVALAQFRIEASTGL